MFWMNWDGQQIRQALQARACYCGYSHIQFFTFMYTCHWGRLTSSPCKNTLLCQLVTDPEIQRVDLLHTVNFILVFVFLGREDEHCSLTKLEKSGILGSWIQVLFRPKLGKFLLNIRKIHPQKTESWRQNHFFPLCSLSSMPVGRLPIWPLTLLKLLTFRFPRTLADLTQGSFWTNQILVFLVRSCP